MKVAHLLRKYNPAEWGGTETALHRLCDGLGQSGVESLVYCPRLPSEVERDPLAEVGCRIKRFGFSVPIWGLAPEEKKRMIAVGGNLMSFGLIRALWREPGLDVIHSHAMGRIGGIGLTVARRRRLPFLFTTHGGLYDLPPALRKSHQAASRKGWEWGKLCGFFLGTRRLLAEADLVITCNGREAALIRERHPRQEVVVHPHGVRAQLYEADQRAAARAAFPALVGRKVLLVLGRIDAIKNQAWVVEQMTGLVRRHPGVLLVLAGASTDQGYTDALIRRIGQLGLERAVFLAGGLPPGDPRLIGLLQEARVVILPSISETFGLVILESWAAGTPVLSTQTSGAKSLLADGETGLLFDLARPEEFHAGADRLLADPAWASRLAAAGRKRVSTNFDTRTLADRMRRLYEGLIERKHALRHSA